MAAGPPELGQKLLTSCCSLLPAADGFINPNYEDYCPAQICVSGAVVRLLPKCPFSLPANYSSGQVGHGPASIIGTQDTENQAKAPSWPQIGQI